MSSNAIFVLLAIAAIILTGYLFFYKWVQLQGVVANELNCKAKQQTYCTDLNNDENPNWDEIEPKTGCEQYEVVRPSEDDCKRQYG